MSRYNAAYNFPVAFPPQTMDNVLAEWLAAKGLKQCHIAGLFPQFQCQFRVAYMLIISVLETEKYAHVTFFFNGGIEKQFEKEDRIMIPSPKVDNLRLHPSKCFNEVTFSRSPLTIRNRR